MNATGREYDTYSEHYDRGQRICFGMQQQNDTTRGGQIGSVDNEAECIHFGNQQRFGTDGYTFSTSAIVFYDHLVHE